LMVFSLNLLWSYPYFEMQCYTYPHFFVALWFCPQLLASHYDFGLCVFALFSTLNRGKIALREKSQSWKIKANHEVKKTKTK
jgi:hypothetical protein